MSGNRVIFRKRASLAGLLVLLLLTGVSCQYKLGSGSPRLFDSVAVLPVLNDTQVPQIEPVLDGQIREQLLQGGMKIASESSADALLQVRLVGYDREMSSVRSDDSGLALSYGLRLRAEVTLTLASGEVLLDRSPVEIHREAFVEDGVQVAEYQTLPVMARDLAGRIRRKVLDTW